MNAVTEKALFHLTHKGNITDVNVDELKNLATEHPYFAPAQFLLAAKLKKDDHFLHDAQLQKASLFFHNLNWLQYQLNGEHETNGHAFITPKKKVETNSAINETNAPVEFWKEEPVQPIAAEKIPEPAPSFSYTPEFAIPTVENVKEILYNIDHNEEKVTVPEMYPETIQEPILKTSLPTYSEAFHSIVAPKEEPVQEIVPTIERYESNGQDDQDKKLQDILSNQLADLKKPVAQDAKLDFEMEPYYTIDYFASQGIKVDLTQQPQDKLTQQLLKFTDWLKKMKNVSPNPQDLGTDPELEKAISGIANASNEAKEIVTETMAEVFVKQGKVDKAVQLFIKLSFLEPEKSAYFAAKIQQLKGL